MTSKLITRICLCLLLTALIGSSQNFVAPGRVNTSVTVVTAGTPVRVSTNTTLVVDRIFIQAAVGGGMGTGYICIVPNGTTPAASCGTAGQLGAQLAPATATAPGSSYSDNTPSSQTAGISPSQFWLDASVNNTVFTVSFNVR